MVFITHYTRQQPRTNIVSWGKAIIIFWVIILTSCSKQNLVTVKYEVCLDTYHEHFFLEHYDEHMCLHIGGNCDIDTLTIKVK